MLEIIDLNSVAATVLLRNTFGGVLHNKDRGTAFGLLKVVILKTVI